MFPFLKKAREQFSKRTETSRKPRRTRLVLEALEERLVPSAMSDIPYQFPTGPTLLALNFDGEDFYSSGGILGFGSNSINVAAYNAGTPAQTDQNIQDILFRVSEIYAPFNVEVTRIQPAGTYDSNNGNTTIFVGSSNFGAGTTPSQYTDYPRSGNSDHIRNSDPYDLAFVDPSANNNGAVADTAVAIAHEAGHTFGLAHVRTDGVSYLQDGSTQPPSSVSYAPDIMSYDRATNLGYFVDQELPLTGWNATSNGLQFQPDQEYPDFGGSDGGINPTTQNSFVCLRQVLGMRPTSGQGPYHVADVGAIDPGLATQYVHPNSDNAPNDQDSIITWQGRIDRLGDYDVYRWTAPASETIQLQLTASNGLNPVVMMYDNNGKLTFGGNGSVPKAIYDNYGNVTFSGSPVQTDTGNNLLYVQDSYGPRGSLQVTGGQSYYFVVGAQDSDSMGNYSLTLNQLPSFAQLSGTQLTINADPNALVEALSIQTDAQGRLNVSLNGISAWFEPGQVSIIQVNPLGNNSNITVFNAPVPISVLGADQLIINDSANSNGQEFDIYNNGVVNYGNSVIDYQSVNMLTILGGRGGNWFQVQGTSSPTLLVTGVGTHNTVDIAADSNPVTIVGQATQEDKVTIGSNHTLTTIPGPVTLKTISQGTIDLTIDDQSDPNAHNVSVSGDGVVFNTETLSFIATRIFGVVHIEPMWIEEPMATINFVAGTHLSQLRIDSPSVGGSDYYGSNFTPPWDSNFQVYVQSQAPSRNPDTTSGPDAGRIIILAPYHIPPGGWQQIPGATSFYQTLAVESFETTLYTMLDLILSVFGQPHAELDAALAQLHAAMTRNPASSTFEGQMAMLVGESIALNELNPQPLPPG